MLLVLQIVAGLLLPFSNTALVPAFLTAMTALIAIRWRGSFNGGSDTMTFLILFNLAIARAASAHPLIMKYALGYIAAQCVLSYFMAGFAKLRNASWRNGQAFAHLLRSSVYSIPARAKGLADYPKICRAFAWATICFEFCSPLVFVNSVTGWMFVSCATVFHLSNVYSIRFESILLGLVVGFSGFDLL